jgi:hypothetical protein
MTVMDSTVGVSDRANGQKLGCLRPLIFPQSSHLLCAKMYVRMCLTFKDKMVILLKNLEKSLKTNRWRVEKLDSIYLKNAVKNRLRILCRKEAV